MNYADAQHWQRQNRVTDTKKRVGTKKTELRKHLRKRNEVLEAARRYKAETFGLAFVDGERV